MQFFFCETCGKRITEKDVEAGRARNKKLKGVFCSDCAVGVMTMEMMPVSEEEARRMLNKPATPPAGAAVLPTPGKPKRETTGINIAAVKKPDAAAARGSPAREAPPPKHAQQNNSVVIGVAAGLAIALVLGVLLLAGGGDKPKPAAKAEPAETQQPAEPARPYVPPERAEPKHEKPDAPPVPPQEPAPEPKTQPELEPAKLPAPPPAEPATASETVTLKHAEFEGGLPFVNYWLLGKDGVAIYSQQSGCATLRATFKLALPATGPGMLTLDGLCQDLMGSCKLALELNGKTIFEGPDPATVPKEWSRQTFKIPAGVLAQGENKLAIHNREATGAKGKNPWYMLHAVELRTNLEAATPRLLASLPCNKLINPIGSVAQVNANVRNSGRRGTNLYGSRQSLSKLTARIELPEAPEGDGLLKVFVMRTAECQLQVLLNDHVVYEGPGAEKMGEWSTLEARVPAAAFTAGTNRLLYRCITPVDQNTYSIGDAELLALPGPPAAAEPKPAAAIRAADFKTSYLNANVRQTGRAGAPVWGPNAATSKTSAKFTLDRAHGAGVLKFHCMRMAHAQETRMQVLLGQEVLYEGTGPAKVHEWETLELNVPAGMLTEGEHTLTLKGLTQSPDATYFVTAADLFAQPADLKLVHAFGVDDFKTNHVTNNLGGDPKKRGAQLFGTNATAKYLSTSFQLASAPGPGVLKLECMRFQSDSRIQVVLNNQVLYEGIGPAQLRILEYIEFKVPAQAWTQGENTLTLRSLNASRDRVYLICGGEFLAAPGTTAGPAAATPAASAFPPILTEEQRTALQFHDETLAHLRSQQLDKALAAARAAARPEAKPLAGLLERAVALQQKALEAIAKKPPTGPVKVRFKDEELTGQLKRIEGAFAWVLAKGLELRIGVEDLPEDLLLTALALDPATPEGQRDLLALHFGAGRLAEALNVARKLQPPDAELLALLEQAGELRNRALFAKAVAEIEAAIAAAKSQEAQTQLANLRRAQPALAGGEQAARLKDLEARAEGAKLATRIRALFKGEVLAFREDLYIELKYDFTRDGANRDDFTGATWALGNNGLHYTQRGGLDTTLVFKIPLQPRAARFEILQGAEHDFTYGHLGKVVTKVRWAQGGTIHTVFGDTYTGLLYEGKPWKTPASGGIRRYIFERTDTEVVFTLDKTEYHREKLPAEAATEKSLTLRMTPSRSVDAREIVIKGYLDKTWVQEALKNLPAETPPGKPGAYLPGLWGNFFHRDGVAALKSPLLSRMEKALELDYGEGSPDPALRANDFCIVLEGLLKVEKEGEYQFASEGNDYIKVLLGGKVLSELDNGTSYVDRKPNEKADRAILAAGYHPLVVKCWERFNKAHFQVRWKAPGSSEFTEIPAAALWHEAAQEKQAASAHWVVP